MIKKFAARFWKKWIIAFKILPLLAVVAVLKILSHTFGYEVLGMNAVFTSLVAGTIFLLSFLISGNMPASLLISTLVKLVHCRAYAISNHGNGGLGSFRERDFHLGPFLR